MGKTVITYGTFDCFHYGHYNLLKRAAALGDRLIVGVSSDKMCREKGKVPFFDEKYRSQIVSDLVFVDQVILEESMEQKSKTRGDSVPIALFWAAIIGTSFPR